ncbi:GDSL-type esterase/lipase family protein [Pseudonocardia spirodelae]|uniref:GDSL-type esterase/lipase family protein n=1 Tax=Pseudonocardia spirodelae TaxID=3133431 RepID=A0ABU8TE25_9PSEU
MPGRRVATGLVAAAVAVAVSVLPTADRPEDTEVPAALDDPGVVRVMPLGASSTVGVGSPETAGYRLPLWERLAADGVPVDFVGSRSTGPDALPDADHEGRSGWTAARMVPLTGGWVLAALPDVVLLHAGTNDLLMGADARATATSLDRMLERIFAAAPDTHVIMAGVWAPLPRQRTERARLHAYLPRVAAAHRAAGHSVEYVDVAGLFPAGRTADGLHAGPGAYRTIAGLWADRIEAYLGRGPGARRR